MASNARQSVFGGLFARSLNFVVLPFFMRLGSSGRNDADDISAHRVRDDQHATIDEADGVVAKLPDTSCSSNSITYGSRNTFEAVLKSMRCFFWFASCFA